MTIVSRRQFITGASAMTAFISAFDGKALSAPAGNQFDFSKPLEGWESISGQWTIQSVAGASRNGMALVQGATDNEYNVIVAPGGPYRDVRVSVRFRPISGREDASGGVVFRFSEGRYYLIRANALEDNFRLYYFDRDSCAWTVASAANHGPGRPHPGMAKRAGFDRRTRCSFRQR